MSVDLWHCRLKYIYMLTIVCQLYIHDTVCDGSSINIRVADGL